MLADKREASRARVIAGLKRQVEAIQAGTGIHEEGSGGHRMHSACGDDASDTASRSVGASSESKDPTEAAFQRIVDLCSYHEFSREKMRQRLQREHVAAEPAAAALDRAVACGLIDDVRYGEALCAGRMHALRGTAGIERELLWHHIDPDSIQGWPQDYEERYGAETERALRVIEQHPPRSQHPQVSAYRRLVGKGYAPRVASQVSHAWWNAQGNKASH